MRATKFLLIKLLLFFVAASIAGTTINSWTRNAYNDSLLASYIDKLSALDECKGNKTVFVGGSSVLFGINAKYFEELTGEVSRNMGLQALRSYDIYFSTIDEKIKAGDTVILALEYNAYQYEWNQFDDVGLDLAWLCGYGENLDLLEKVHYEYSAALRGFTRAYDTFYKSCIQPIFKQQEKLYLRRSVNSFGDMTGYENMKSSVSEGSPFRFQINPDTCEKILNYIIQWEEKGATVFIVFPPYCIAEGDYSNSINSCYDSIVEWFGKRVLDTPQDSMTNNVSVFFDTTYHLTYSASIDRTKYLAELLSKS